MLTRRTLVFLAFAAVLVSAAAYFLKTQTGDSGSGRRTLLPAGRPGAVRRVSFSFGGAVSEIENIGGTWKFAAVGRGRVDSVRMSEILGVMADAVVRDRVTARQRANRDLALDKYGLDPAPAVVGITDAAGEISVAFGTNSIGAFASVEGSGDVCMVDRSVFDLLPKSENDLLNRMPFALDGRAVECFEIRRSGEPAIRVARSESGSGWNMLSPMECAADPEFTENALEAVVDSVVEKYVSEPQLTSEETAVSLLLWYRGDPAPRAFAFGRPESGSTSPVRVSALTDGGECLVKYDVFAALSTPSDAFREHRLFSFEPDCVTSVSARFNDISFKLSKSPDDGSWAFVQPSVQCADAERVGGFIASLCALCDTNAVAADAVPGPPPGGVEIELGASSGCESFTFCDGAAFSKTMRRWIAAESWPGISRRDFMRLCSLSLFGTNSEFSAESVESLSPADSAAYGLLPPAVVEFSINSGDTNRPVAVVQLGLEGPEGSRFLRVKGRDAVFTVSSGTVARLLLKAKENGNETQSEESR